MLKIDLFNIIFTVVNLFILFFVIWKFLFKPVKKIIAKRQEEVDEQYKNAQDAQTQADENKAMYEEKLKAAEDEKTQIIKDGRAKADSEYDSIISDAKCEAQKIVDMAKKDADAAKEKSIQQAKEEIADIVSEAVTKISGVKSDAEADRKLFDDFFTKSGE